MSFRNYAVQRNEHKKPSSLPVTVPIDTHKESKNSFGGLERLPSANNTTLQRSVPLLVTGTQITCNELHLAGRSRKPRPNHPACLEERTLSLPKIIHHANTSDVSSFKVASSIPNILPNQSGSTSIKRVSNEDRIVSLRENSFRLDSTTSQDQRSFLQTSSIKCLPSDGKLLSAKCKTNSMPMLKKSPILPTLPTGAEFKSELNFEQKNTDLEKNIVQASQYPNSKNANGNDRAIERRRLDALNRAKGEEVGGKEIKERPSDTLVGDCSVDDLASVYADRIMRRTVSAITIKRAFEQVWPQFLRKFVEETLNDFENMSEHMKLSLSNVLDDI